MPKKALILKDFTSGLVYSEHGADLPNNSISQGGNFNINRRLGVLELAGKWQEAVRPDDVAQDGTTESFQFGGNFVGIPGRGLFYFTSDYSDMENDVESGGAGYDNFFEQDSDHDNWRLGPTSVNDFPTEYFVIGSRHTNQGYATQPGQTGSVLHIYQVVRPHTSIDLLGNNTGVNLDGKYNGIIVDIFMGGINGADAYDISDPNYAEKFFPVYYWATGALRVCDGGFSSQNTTKIWLGYVRDKVLFSGLTENFTGALYEIDEFKVDNWVIDRGSESILATLDSPTVRFGYFRWQDTTNSIDEVTLASLDPENSITTLIVAKNTAGAMAPDGETFPAFGAFDKSTTGGTGYGITSVEVGRTGMTLFTIHVRGKDSQEEEFGPMPNVGAIDLPKSNSKTGEHGWDLYFSYVYENGQESKLTEVLEADVFTTNDGGPISFRVHGKDLHIDVRWAVPVNHARIHPRVVGAKAYIKTLGESSLGGINSNSDYFLLSEMNFAEGARGPGDLAYNSWKAINYTDYDAWTGLAQLVVCKNSVVALSETFAMEHGYSPEDIKPCYYKTACTVNNRVYVGNVKFDGTLYPDRMMKTQVGEYDVFHSNGFIDVQVDDGDSIIHLEAFADRILQFKENVVHVINISKEFEFLETSVKYAGIKSPCQVVQTEKGIYWANIQGLWLYNGQQVVNLFQHKGLNVAKESVTLTSDIINDVSGEWKDVILEDKDKEPVLSYDPVSKDVIIMTQRKDAENLIKNHYDSYINDAFSGVGWAAYGSPTAFGWPSEESGGDLALQVTTSTSATNQGASLPVSRITSLVAGNTYRVQAKIENNTNDVSTDFDSNPTIKFSLGGTASNIKAYDGAPLDSTVEENVYRYYYADITIANTTGDLIIYNPASTDAGTFRFRMVSVKPIDTPVDEISFVWNTDRNNLSQLFHRATETSKSNSITTVDGLSVFYRNPSFAHHVGYSPGSDIYGDTGIIESQSLMVWNRDAQVDAEQDKLNLYLLTKPLDFDNHAARKVIQSVHFTYKSNGNNYLVPFIKAFYLDGDSSATYYMCTSAASGVDSANLNGASFVGILPDTSNKYETFRYKHVLDSGVSGNAVSLRSKIKNVGAIQIGLVKLHVDAALNSDFSLEEVSITYRPKRPK